MRRQRLRAVWPTGGKTLVVAARSEASANYTNEAACSRKPGRWCCWCPKPRGRSAHIKVVVTETRLSLLSARLSNDEIKRSARKSAIDMPSKYIQLQLAKGVFR